MLIEKFSNRFAGMIACAILDQEVHARYFGQYLCKETDVTGAIEFILNAFVEQTALEKLDQAKHLVSFPVAARFNLELLSAWSPSIGQGTP